MKYLEERGLTIEDVLTSDSSESSGQQDTTPQPRKKRSAVNRALETEEAWKFLNESYPGIMAPPNELVRYLAAQDVHKSLTSLAILHPDDQLDRTCNTGSTTTTNPTVITTTLPITTTTTINPTTTTTTGDIKTTTFDPAFLNRKRRQLTVESGDSGAAEVGSGDSCDTESPDCPSGWYPNGRGHCWYAQVIDAN